MIYKEFKYAVTGSTHTQEYWDFSRFMLETVVPTLSQDTCDLQAVRVWFYTPISMPVYDVLTERIGFEPLVVVSISSGTVENVHPGRYVDVVFATPYSISALIC